MEFEWVIRRDENEFHMFSPFGQSIRENEYAACVWQKAQQNWPSFCSTEMRNSSFVCAHAYINELIRRRSRIIDMTKSSANILQTDEFAVIWSNYIFKKIARLRLCEIAASKRIRKLRKVSEKRTKIFPMRSSNRLTWPLHIYMQSLLCEIISVSRAHQNKKRKDETTHNKNGEQKKKCVENARHAGAVASSAMSGWALAKRPNIAHTHTA